MGLVAGVFESRSSYPNAEARRRGPSPPQPIRFRSAMAVRQCRMMAGALACLSKPNGPNVRGDETALREGEQQSPGQITFAGSPTPSKRPTSRSRSRRGLTP